MEELSDMLVIIDQFRIHYLMPDKCINEIKKQKVNRTIDRIEKGEYNERGVRI